ncbi:hypothetical protein GCM10023189_08490 [Nibrella saemangeumensis]|uniref:DUF306 domain-containing protein n=1 Tax=Nibrella saemangeumensis TaxID=1084526 RepID=A0ABP8MHY8_9BACT
MKTVMMTMLALLAMTFTACDPVVEPESEFKTSGVNQLIGHWRLIEPASSYTVTMDITPDSSQGGNNRYRINGLSSVNYYFSSLTVSGSDAVALETIGATKRGGSAEAMQFEQSYFNKLKAVNRYQLSGNRLTLYAGSERLVYERQASDPQLIGRWKWVKVTYGFTQTTSTPEKAGYTETLEFYADGTYKRFRNDKEIETRLVYSGNNPTQTAYKNAILFPATQEAQPYEIKDGRLFLYERGPAEATIADGGIYEYEKVK